MVLGEGYCVIFFYLVSARWRRDACLVESGYSILSCVYIRTSFKVSVSYLALVVCVSVFSLINFRSSSSFSSVSFNSISSPILANGSIFLPRVPETEPFRLCFPPYFY